VPGAGKTAKKGEQADRCFGNPKKPSWKTKRAVLLGHMWGRPGEGEGKYFVDKKREKGPPKVLAAIKNKQPNQRHTLPPS